MNTTHLQVWLTVVECGSFSGAALRLNTSQSAVSRAIAALEEELGVPLLLRGRFGARLTPVGERILPHARQILQARDSIDHEIHLEKSVQGGRVRVASFRSAATHLVPPLIAKFYQRFPGVEVTLTESDPTGVELALREGRVDLGLVPLPRPSEGLEIWEIARDEFVVLLPPDASPVGDRLAWDDMANYSFILYNYAECTSAVRNHCTKLGHEIKVAHEIRADSTIVSMVSQGLGAAILPRLAAIPIPSGVQVRSLPAPLERIIGAAMLTTALHSPAVFNFLDLLRGTGVFASSVGTANLGGFAGATVNGNPG
jgi:DNA-binding transcriptional LysR family regulator